MFVAYHKDVWLDSPESACDVCWGVQKFFCLVHRQVFL